MSKLELYKKLLKKTQAVLYDFDGVLVDSEKYYYLSYKKAFAELGHTLNADEYWEYWTSLGAGIVGEMERHNLALSKKTIQWIYQERKKNYIRFIQEGKIKFIGPSYKTISLFHKMNKHTIIASNSFEKDLKLIFKKNSKPLNIQLIGRKKGLRAKPEPDIFIYAAGFLKTEPQNCLVIEDAHKGLFAAKAAGMACAVIRNKYNKNLYFKDADIIFDSYTEFYNMTKELQSLF